ncbi:MAG: hypothetical protein PHU04_01335 [Candidatus Peribacteraceae bacterium]|nr:hypothetical protein [Candidatus Peribacteraceae bacterium]
MKHLFLSIFVASLFSGNFCPMRAVHVQAADMPVVMHQQMAHAANHEPCQPEPAQTFQNAPCTGNACFLGEYVADQRSSSLAKQTAEPAAFSGIIPGMLPADTPMDFPVIVTPPGGSLPSLRHIATIVLRT